MVRRGEYVLPCTSDRDGTEAVLARIQQPMVRRPRADLLAAVVLLGASILWAWLTWGRLYDPIVDQGWYMQVSTRLSGGEVLYRDMIWMYGPLPVYLLSLLFRWLGTNVTTFLLLYYALAALGCLLTYRIARFLLAPPLALLGTLALFLGGWWGGFIGYTQAYTGAVPLGTVLGLLLVLCLLSYLRDGRVLWLVGAGLSSGAALLTKPEFGVACVGTGLLLLAGVALFPRGLAGDHGGKGRALAVYAISTVLVAGIGYGALALQAGWGSVWVGITGYDQDAILLREWPPWGNPESWWYIVSGLGVYLLASVLLVAVAVPATLRKRPLGMILLGGLGLLLALLPWRELSRINPGLIASMRASWPALIEQGIRVFWAPATVVLAILIVTLGILWIRAHLRQQPLGRTAGYLAVLALYTALADIRSFLYPTGTFHFLYLDTFFPLLLFLAAIWLPGVVGARWRLPVRASRVWVLLVVALLGYAAAGLIWDRDYYSRLDTPWVSPRGTALFNSSHERRRAWPELLQYILEHTEPDDAIAVLGQEPGFYFWSGRRNPLRQDTLLPGMESSPEDAQEIVRRFESDHPRLIAIPQGVTYGRGWFWELDVGRQAYQDLVPVWQYISTHHEFRGLVGGETWGYAIYEPREDLPRAVRGRQSVGSRGWSPSIAVGKQLPVQRSVPAARGTPAAVNRFITWVPMPRY